MKKKAYTKPKVYIENIDLAQQIASCGAGSRGNGNHFGKANSADAYHCEFEVKGIVLFAEGNNACKRPLKPGASFNGYCYNTVSAEHTIFAS